MKRNLSSIILTFVFITGLSLLLYPSVSNFWNARHATRAISSYAREVAEMDKTQVEVMLAEAAAYNQEILNRTNCYRMSEEEIEAYDNLLNLAGDGVMGYLEIESLGISLPVCHTAQKQILQKAVGHLEWTSLPVGGESTHCVLSGHRGLPSARLFTDLDKLREGDTFKLNILSEILTYEVDQIRIVEPLDTNDLLISEGKDYCTLVTCTPYGINTHRLLVRGYRIQTETAVTLRIVPEAMVVEPLLVAPFLGVPMLLILLLWLLRKRPNASGYAKDWR